ncbi:hypothetical protein [Rhodoluna sp.]|uniref:alpha-L-rhamnosidase-related protein n=1 Tax=Rhodoluna sp. TaxID=1969481 RepID=UPI0025FEABFD|nr:hypothetical protein [Rhodoluna sp.]
MWDTGFHFGEWFVPGEEIDFPSLMSADKGVIATAFYRKSTHELTIIAGLLGKQADCVRALSYQLVDESQKGAVIDQLVKLIHEAGNHLGTGFLATPLLLPTLAASSEHQWVLILTGKFNRLLVAGSPGPKPVIKL